MGRVDQPMLLNICLYIIIRTVMICASCCTRKDSGAQSNPKIVELRCRHDCLDSYGDFWIGGREGVGWSDGGRAIIHVVDLQRRPSATISTSMFVQANKFGNEDKIGLILRYDDMENYVVIVTNINDRNTWRVEEVKENKRTIFSTESFKNQETPREMFNFQFSIDGENMRCRIKSEDSRIELKCPPGCLQHQLPAPYCFAKGDLRWNVLGCYFPILLS